MNTEDLRPLRLGFDKPLHKSQKLDEVRKSSSKDSVDSGVLLNSYIDAVRSLGAESKSARSKKTALFLGHTSPLMVPGYARNRNRTYQPKKSSTVIEEAVSKMNSPLAPVKRGNFRSLSGKKIIRERQKSMFGEIYHSFSPESNDNSIGKSPAVDKLSPWNRKKLELAGDRAFETRIKTPDTISNGQFFPLESQYMMNTTIDEVDDQSLNSEAYSVGTSDSRTFSSQSVADLSALYEREESSYSSIALFAEARLAELWEREGGSGEVPNAVKTAVCVDLIKKVTRIFGRYATVLEPLLDEILNAIFIDYYRNVNRLARKEDLTLADYYKLPTFFDKNREMNDRLEEAEEELDLHNAGVDMKQAAAKFKTVQMAFNGPMMFIRDACFFAWQKEYFTKRKHRRRLVLIKKQLMFNRWRAYIAPASDFDVHYDLVEEEEEERSSSTSSRGSPGARDVLGKEHKDSPQRNQERNQKPVSPSVVIKKEREIVEVEKIVHVVVEKEGTVITNVIPSDSDTSSDVLSDTPLHLRPTSKENIMRSDSVTESDVAVESDEEDIDENEVEEQEQGSLELYFDAPLNTVSCQTPSEWMFIDPVGKNGKGDDDDDDEEEVGPSTKKGRKTKKKAIEVSVKMATSMISTIYDMALADFRKEKVNFSTTTLMKFIEALFILRYGIRSIAENYVVGLTNCCRKKSGRAKRVELFADIAGLPTLTHPDRIFSPTRCTFFFNMLNKLFLAKGDSITAAFNSGYVSKDAALKCMVNTFIVMQVRRPETYKFLETLLEQLPVQIKETKDAKLFKISLDETLSLLMQFAMQEQTLDTLQRLDFRIIIKLNVLLKRWAKRFKERKAARDKEK